MKRENGIYDDEFEDEKDKAEFEKGGLALALGPMRYHYSELAAAMGNFAEEMKLGRGGFGHVYQCCLRIEDQDRHVAIKKLSLNHLFKGGRSLRLTSR